MRSAGYAVVQQAMVEVAAAAVWQAANLARRRGHAQVTPLHVASAMLSTGGLLRAACLRSSSHSKSPALRPEALQFCLDVALSRLPMVWPPAAAMFRHHGAPVLALSNALVAALKRAQAHERRGSADGGQRQPGGLVVKVGLEQLVVSILDDPSVDRALREAGFSGHQVKANPTCLQQKFIELTSENLKILCDALERCVPWRKDIAPAIAATVLRCRSGMMRPASSMAWLLFRGNDVNGKRAMAQELAKLVFGSYSEFTLINSADTSSNAGDRALKRRRSPDVGNGYVGIRLFEALIEEPHRVVFIDNIDQIDHESEIAIKNVIATGRVMGCNGAGIASLEDAIVVLSSEVSEPRSFASASPLTKRRRIGGLDPGEGAAERQVESHRFAFDLNAPMEDAEEQEEVNSVDSMGIMGVVDGVFHFD
ncbi:protein SMAX1-LIKE 3-like [Lolium rigidum]|uniref:protein SMAX1-LIKE 3-like n=1 Tax=Lolium rigidum TaxID=89674 RepID=UPI001F5E32A7|nr:protein SMAX1-LIKE 3-like [Lolium rigidum]